MSACTVAFFHKITLISVPLCPRNRSFYMPLKYFCLADKPRIHRFFHLFINDKVALCWNFFERTKHVVIRKGPDQANKEPARNTSILDCRTAPQGPERGCVEDGVPRLNFRARGLSANPAYCPHQFRYGDDSDHLYHISNFLPIYPP